MEQRLGHFKPLLEHKSTLVFSDWMQKNGTYGKRRAQKMQKALKWYVPSGTLP